LRKNGFFVNPRVEHGKLPPGDPISTAHLAAFHQQRDEIAGRMATALAESARPRPDAVRTIQ
jgi:hypothetical protein